MSDGSCRIGRRSVGIQVGEDSTGGAAAGIDRHDLPELMEQPSTFIRGEALRLRQLFTPLQGFDVLPDVPTTLFAQGFEPCFQQISIGTRHLSYLVDRRFDYIPSASGLKAGTSSMLLDQVFQSAVA
jgi:hypothetical protein